MHTPLKILTLLAALALFARLGSAPLLDADEGRNAEVGREMAETNDYVLPRLDGLPYLDKPIVYFAAEAAVMEVLGPTELAARLPAYLFTMATALLLFLFARHLFDEESAWIAAIVFLAMPLTIAFARIVIFDSALTFFITAATMGFFLAVETGEKRWAILAWLAIGFGILTKGPVAILLPLLAAIPYAIKRRRFGALWSFLGIVLCAAVVAPWVWAVERHVPDFLEYVVMTETAARLATKELQRTGPPWYFLPYLIAGALPWSIVLIASWRPLRARWGTILYLLLWIGVPLIFFSISQSKRPQYIVPLMVPIGLLVAAIWREAKTRLAAIALAVFGALLLIAPMLPALTRKMRPVLVEPARLTAFSLGAALLLGGIAALIFARRPRAALAALAIPVLLLPLLSDPLLRALGERRSAKSFIAQLGPHLGPETQLIGIEAFTGSIAFYARRPVTLVSEDGSELTSNYILRRYERYSTNPHAPLKPMAWIAGDLASCCAPRVYITRNNDDDARRLLESRGMRLVAEGAHHVAYTRAAR